MSTILTIDATRKLSNEVRGMFESIAPNYDRANAALSFGLHKIWHFRLLRLINSSDSPVLDLCTGTGELLRPIMAKVKYAIGVDFCMPMLKIGAKRNAKSLLLQGDGLCLPLSDNTFGAVTVAFGVRNFENTQKGLAEIYRVLKPGGKVVILEFGQPYLPGFKQVFQLYSKWVMPLVGGLLTGNREAYQYLPETSSTFPCRENFTSLLTSLGFELAKYHALSFGVAYIYVGRKPSAHH